ncbi:MAG: hypothetical protein AB7F50_02860 [Fimbriimonadaceae bacterium]
MSIGPNQQNANPNLGDPAVPSKFVSVPGLGAFVLLDYRTGYDLNHLEHSVVFLPESFDTLHELMARPQEFFNRVLSSYSDVKGYNTGTGAADIAVSQWPLAGPVTIHIEPLTSPSFQNLAMLQALSTLYPGFAGLGSQTGGSTLNENIGSFRKRVIAAAQGEASPTQVAAAGAEHESMVASLLVREKERGHGTPQRPHEPAPGSVSHAVVHATTQGGQQPAQSTTAAPALPTPFDLQYVVEFALDTRLVTVRYIPRHVQYPAVTSHAGLLYKRNVTPVTRNPIKYMGFEFLHFDLDMANASDYHADMAERRADFAMDFIKNPKSLEVILGNVAAGGGNSPYMLMTDHLTQTGNPLHQKFGGTTGKPTIDWPMNRDPVIILESVRPDPAQDWNTAGAPGQNQLLGGNDPNNPTPCVIVVYVNGVPVYIVVKNYN